MTAVKGQQDQYFAHFAALEERLAGTEPEWLRAVRKSAIERFGDLGFPTTHDEEWRFTSVAPIARTAFRPPPERVSPADARFGQSERADFAHCTLLVFVNGRYVEDLASPNGLPAGVRVRSLRAALASEPETLEPYLARYAPFERNAFAALNTALMEDGAFVEVGKDVALERPIYLLFLAAPLPGESAPAAYHPRNLIVVGRGSQATVVEHYLSAGGAGYFTNAVTEAVVGDNARLDYTKVQQESGDAYHIGTVQVHQARFSSVTTRVVALGGVLNREDTCTVLDGEGAESLLQGLYVIHGRQHVDNHTTIDHAQPHCSSRELYKGVLDGASNGVFNGKIIVRRGAQKTDSKQSNKNLLLSESAVINTKPQLEIYADDVKCTHGATIGQMDPEAVFYLRSRGIGLEEARAMLIEAFANDILDRIPLAPLRTRLQRALTDKLAAKGRPAGTGALPAGERVSVLVEEA
jgi:Fe-S cluster assembly protein SufD